MKIRLPLHDMSCNKWRVVDAEIVPIAPHLTNATFAVHRCPWSVVGSWKVTNVETGCVVGAKHWSGGYFISRDQAMNEMEPYLATKTVRDVERAYRTLPSACRR